MDQDGTRGRVCTDLRWDGGRVEWVRTGRGAECALTCLGMGYGRVGLDGTRGRVCTDLRWDGGRVEWIRTGRGAECALTCLGMGAG